MKMIYKISFAICVALAIFSFVGCDSINGLEGEGESFTVTFASNGGQFHTTDGDTPTYSATVQSGQKVTKPTDPTKNIYTFTSGNSDPTVTKYVFIGWYSDSELKKRFDFSTTITEDKTLYAKWQTIAKSGITIGSGNSAVTYEKTEEVIVIPPEKTGTSKTRVTGSRPSFLDDDAEDNDLGVFWQGRNPTISPFVMGRYEVTQKLYKDVMVGNGESVEEEPSICTPATGGDYDLPDVDGDETQDNRPVENITWYDAVYFCNQLTETLDGDSTNCVYNILNITVTSDHITSATVTWDKSKSGYRLPTEVEWEYAARGGEPDIDAWNYMFSGADSASGKKYSDTFNSGLDAVGWYGYNTAREDGVTNQDIPGQGSTDRISWGTHETGSKGYNELGLYDMSGNVAEWCCDIPQSYIEDDPDGAGVTGTTRAIRGGAWYGDAHKCVVTYRDSAAPNTKANNIGIRLVRTLPTN